MGSNTLMILPKGLNAQLTKNFNSSEMDCKCNYDTCTETIIDIEHLGLLQRLRDKIGRLSITSAYRCPRHNKAVGGSTKSQHKLGTATDIVSHTLTPEEVAKEANKLFNGMGVYKTFVHIDSRTGKRARW